MNANSATVSERIYTAIRDDILNKTLVSGEKLTIKKLHEMYGVSSSPIREALFRLQQDGLIEYRSNAGMRVIEFTRQDLAEIYMLLTEFDVIALRAATTPARRLSTLAALELCMEKSRASIENNLWNFYSDAFHSILYEEARNGRLTDAARKIRIQSTIFSNQYEIKEENRREILKQHEEILNAIRDNRLDRAEDLMRTHVGSSYAKALSILDEEEEESEESSKQASARS